MCGRYGLIDLKKLKERFDLVSDEFLDLKPRYNIAPSQNLPVMVKDQVSGHNKAELMRWGLIPSWSPDGKFASINARAETVATKSSFSRPLRTKRCLIPASFFFEWKQTKEGKVPYLIKLKNEEVFSFAGLYDENDRVEDKPIQTYTIITTEPNELMEQIHDRMPVIFKKSDEKIWLDESIIEPKKLLPLLHAFPASLMEAYPVSSLVNAPHNDAPEIIKPA